MYHLVLIDDLLAYMVLLKEWSGTYNLVAPRERDFLLARHVLDSLSIIANWLQTGFLAGCGYRCRLPGIAAGHRQAGNGGHPGRQCRQKNPFYPPRRAHAEVGKHSPACINV